MLCCRLRVELVLLAIAYTGLGLEVLLGIITLWIFQRYECASMMYLYG